MPLIDRRDEMTLPELVDELELAYPEKYVQFETLYPDAMEAVLNDELDDVSDDVRDEVSDLHEAIVSLLRI